MNKNKILSDDQIKERDISKGKKEEELRKKKEEYAQTAERKEENKRKAEEVLEKNKKKKDTSYSYQIMFGLLGALVVYILAMTFFNQTPSLTKVQVIDDSKIQEHNSNFQWKQGPSTFFEGTTLADAKKLFTTGFSNHNNLNRCHIDDSISPPENFFYKDNWAHCALPVEDTGKGCGSSYAFVLAQTLAERACIANASEKSTPLSAQELLSCDVINNGCKGGYLNNSLDHIRAKGLVTQECYPYKPDLTKCEGMCANPERTRLDSYCLLVGEDDIKRDIMKNGPVVTSMQIYVDFLTYKSGIYTKIDEVAKFSGQHAIRIVGWGTDAETATKFWIIQNTWGSSWGEEGYAKIAFGQELFFDQFSYSLKVKPERQVYTPTEEASTQEEQNINLDLDDK